MAPTPYRLDPSVFFIHEGRLDPQWVPRFILRGVGDWILGDGTSADDTWERRVNEELRRSRQFWERQIGSTYPGDQFLHWWYKWQGWAPMVIDEALDFADEAWNNTYPFVVPNRHDGENLVRRLWRNVPFRMFKQDRSWQEIWNNPLWGLPSEVLDVAPRAYRALNPFTFGPWLWENHDGIIRGIQDLPNSIPNAIRGVVERFDRSPIGTWQGAQEWLQRASEDATRRVEDWAENAGRGIAEWWRNTFPPRGLMNFEYEMLRKIYEQPWGEYTSSLSHRYVSIYYWGRMSNSQLNQGGIASDPPREPWPDDPPPYEYVPALYYNRDGTPVWPGWYWQWWAQQQWWHPSRREPWPDDPEPEYPNQPPGGGWDGRAPLPRLLPHPDDMRNLNPFFREFGPFAWQNLWYLNSVATVNELPGYGEEGGIASETPIPLPLFPTIGDIPDWILEYPGTFDRDAYNRGGWDEIIRRRNIRHRFWEEARRRGLEDWYRWWLNKGKSWSGDTWRGLTRPWEERVRHLSRRLRDGGLTRDGKEISRQQHRPWSIEDDHWYQSQKRWEARQAARPWWRKVWDFWESWPRPWRPKFPRL